MDKIMEAFAKAIRGGHLVVAVGEGNTNAGLYEGNLISVDAVNRTISISNKVYKGRVDTLAVDKIISVNGISPRDFLVTETPFSQVSGVHGWTGDGWFDGFVPDLGLGSTSAFAHIPEGTELVIPAGFGGAKTARRAFLTMVDYGNNVATLHSSDSLEEVIEVPIDKVASIENGLIKFVT